MRGHSAPIDVDVTILRDKTIWRTNGDAISVHSKIIQEKLWNIFERIVLIIITIQKVDRISLQVAKLLDFSRKMVYNILWQVMNAFHSIHPSTLLEMMWSGEIDPDTDEYHKTMKILAEKYCFHYERLKKDG